MQKDNLFTTPASFSYLRHHPSSFRSIPCTSSAALQHNIYALKTTRQSRLAPHTRQRHGCATADTRLRDALAYIPGSAGHAPPGIHSLTALLPSHEPFSCPPPHFPPRARACCRFAPSPRLPAPLRHSHTLEQAAYSPARALMRRALSA